MTPQEIKEKVDSNNIKIEALLKNSMFTLNKEIHLLMEENDELQKQCTHDFCFGKCRYCYSEQH